LFEKEILPLLDFVEKRIDLNDLAFMYHYLSILKGLAKAGVYHHMNRPIKIWSKFLSGEFGSSI